MFSTSSTSTVVTVRRFSPVFAGFAGFVDFDFDRFDGAARFSSVSMVLTVPSAFVGFGYFRRRWQAAQGKAARKKHGKGGKIEPQHQSPACAWLDAQHDSRRGPGFLESITGEHTLWRREPFFFVFVLFIWAPSGLIIVVSVLGLVVEGVKPRSRGPVFFGDFLSF